MQVDEIERLIQSVLPDGKIAVQGEGCNFSVVVVSAQFAGLSAVKRQQLVLGALREPLASGALHAITVKAYTPAEQSASRAVWP